MSVRIALIVAVDRNGVIGKRSTNTIPWHLPGDLRYFKQRTQGHVVVMGRLTYESIGHPLPNRVNLILTRNANYTAHGCIVVPSVQAALTWAKRFAANPTLFVIGGSSVYEAFLPLATQLYLTRVDLDSDGDVRFPEWDASQWVCVSREPKKDTKRGTRYSFEHYKLKE